MSSKTRTRTRKPNTTTFVASINKARIDLVDKEIRAVEKEKEKYDKIIERGVQMPDDEPDYDAKFEIYKHAVIGKKKFMQHTYTPAMKSLGLKREKTLSSLLKGGRRKSRRRRKH